MVERNITAIIPARGGSKRIPRKNILELAGKPMIAWTIDAALNSQYISRVIVSTDDEEIAEVAIKYGAEVPFLRDQNSDDHSPISLATIRALNQLKELEGKFPNVVVQLMANCPVRTAEEIDIAIENFISHKVNFQISCFKYGWMNPWWAHRVDDNGLASPLFKKEAQKQGQDLPVPFCPTGAIWIAKTMELLKSNSFYGPNYTFFPLHWTKAIDIDEYEDLEMAKYFMK